MKNRRVVVTGLGIISSVGMDKDTFWDAVLNGKSGITRVTSFDTDVLRCHFAGEVKKFNPENFIARKKIQFLGRTSQLAIAATSIAIDDANLYLNKVKNSKSGILIGTTMGEKPMEESFDSWFKDSIEKIHKEKILQASVNNISSNIANYFKLIGPNYVIPTACAAGNYAIGYGFDLIKKGDLDFAITGGADAFSKLAFFGFHRIYAMSSDKCQPFDKNRKGMMVGEGAGILILESLDSAIRRNAKIYAEILGYGLSCDAFHMTASQLNGIEKVMRNAIKDAEIKPENIDYISVHGTGTQWNDKTECAAIKNVFKGRTKLIPTSSIKSMLGHTMGAASAIEAITCCMIVKEDIIPPTINFETPDPECDIDCVPNKARRKKVNIALNNAFAFGGNNSCLVIKKFN